MKKILITLSLAFILSISIFAQDIYIPDRPGYTYNAQTIGNQNGAAELGFGYIHQISDPGETHLFYNTNAFRYGISNKIELKGEIDFGHVKLNPNVPYKIVNEGGVSGVSLGTKISLYNNNEIINIALVASTYLPYLGTEYFQYPNYSPSLTLAIQKNIEKFSFLANIGQVWNGVNPNSIEYFVKSQQTASIAVYYFPSKLGFFVETASKFCKDIDTYSNFDCGLVYNFSDNFICDLSAGLNYKTGLNDSFINCGLAWKFKNN